MRCWSRPPSRSDAAAAALAALLTLLPAPLPAAASHPADETGAIVVVASTNVPFDDISLAELRRVFLFERRFWKPGQPATVLYPAPGTPARAWLLRHLARTDERELKRIVLEKLYRGDIDLAPKVTETDQEALAFVASGRGLLALVPASIVDGAAVKVLRLDGKAPGGPGYPSTD